MTPTARAMSYEAANDTDHCCVECHRWINDCDCRMGEQFPVIPDMRPGSHIIMHNDGPHDSMNAPSEEVAMDEIKKDMPSHDELLKLCKPASQWESPYADATPVEQVQAERGSCYGDSEFNLGGTALAVTGYLMNKWQMQLPSPITEYDIAMFNALQKINRTAKTPGHKDSLLDTHSFLDLGAKAVQRAAVDELTELGQEMQPEQYRPVPQHQTNHKA